MKTDVTEDLVPWGAKGVRVLLLLVGLGVLVGLFATLFDSSGVRPAAVSGATMFQVRRMAPTMAAGQHSNQTGSGQAVNGGTEPAHADDGQQQHLQQQVQKFQQDTLQLQQQLQQLQKVAPTQQVHPKQRQEQEQGQTQQQKQLEEQLQKHREAEQKLQKQLEDQRQKEQELQKQLEEQQKKNREQEQQLQKQLEKQQQQKQQPPQKEGQPAAAPPPPPPDATWPPEGDPEGNSCRNGFLISPRKVFWQYVNDTGPTLTELYHAEERVYAVFSNKIPVPHQPRWQNELLPGNWTMQFTAAAPSLGIPTRTVQAYDLGKDGHSHSFAVMAPLPKEFLAHPKDQSVRVSLTIQHKEGTQHFNNAPLCLHAVPVQFKHLVACTEITAGAAAAVPEWVAYHSLQGFEHFVIYVNDELSKVRQHLEPLVKAGLVTVVDWQWPSKFDGGHQFQQAEQNGCLMRMRGQARWVGLHDVDEYMQSMRPGATVADVLNIINVLDHIGSLIVPMLAWGSNTNDTLQAGFSEAGKGLMLGQYRSRAKEVGGQKMIANPRGLSYSSVHGITTGGPEHRLDAEKDIRYNHFKPGERLELVDDSLWVQTPAVRTQLEQWGYPSAAP